MKTVGIIGGMGPETTSKFYLDVIFKTYVKNKLQRPPILMWNVPLKYKTEKELIEKAKGEEKYLPYLIKAAKNLEKGGADFIVIPCNTVHVFIEEIRKEVKIPVLSILEEAQKFIKNKSFKLEQKRLGKIINKLVTTKYAEKEKSRLFKIIWNLGKKDCDAIILACTDLQLVIKPKDMPMPVYDTMDLLVDATVRELMK